MICGRIGWPIADVIFDARRKSPSWIQVRAHARIVLLIQLFRYEYRLFDAEAQARFDRNIRRFAASKQNRAHSRDGVAGRLEPSFSYAAVWMRIRWRSAVSSCTSSMLRRDCATSATRPSIRAPRSAMMNPSITSCCSKVARKLSPTLLRADEIVSPIRTTSEVPAARVTLCGVRTTSADSGADALVRAGPPGPATVAGATGGGAGAGGGSSTAVWVSGAGSGWLTTGSSGGGDEWRACTTGGGIGDGFSRMYGRFCRHQELDRPV